MEQNELMSADKIPNDDAFIFANQEDDVDNSVEELKSGNWKILIVDDEPEIHKVTELALDNLAIMDKGLHFLHAYSGAEAIELLKNEADVAVILLDVVMETDDAGLLVVKKIREDLGLLDVRIILRTGQPGYAPEEKVVLEYDINDYRTKTELTRNKLLTSVFSAIRTYSQIIQSSQSRDFLDALNQLNTELIAKPDFEQFVACLVDKSRKLFKFSGDGFLALDQCHKTKQTSDEQGLWIASGIGQYALNAGEKIEHSIDETVINVCRDAFKSKRNIINEQHFVIYIKAQTCTSILYFDNKEQVQLNEELIRTYISSVASDLDNSLLLERVSTIAYRDVLTGAPNRTRFIQMLDELAKGKSTYDTALLIDIDHFSDINDGLGQEVGNNILLSVYKRLEEAIGTKGTVARIGADIFGILSKEADFNYERVLECFVKPISAQEHIIPINVTIGGAKHLSTDQSGISVLKHANIALNRAKKDISSRFSYYQVEMEDETSWRLGMIRRLNTDFEAGKLQVWFQPQICVKSKQIIGMEALLRWPDGNGGFISPATFIPLAEYSGLIVGIGAWVIKESCKVLKQLNDGCFKNLRVAVNVSMPQFRNPSFVDNVLETVKQEGVPPQLLELEITESVVMDDPKLVVAALDDLKRHGFSIAIDDFGTGFSSLSYLQQLPLDRIKVDREFIKDIGEGGDGIIAETVIKLGQKLGLETIAEGIETQEQLDYIESLGCDESQGFLHAKPMPVEELEIFLKDYCKV